MAKNRSAAMESLPWRETEGTRPNLPLPPGSMPLRLAGTWRKRWRYVGAFGENVMMRFGQIVALTTSGVAAGDGVAA